MKQNIIFNWTRTRDKITFICLAGGYRTMRVI